MNKNQFGQVLGHAVEDWIACEKPANSELSGKYCVLEPLSITKHASSLFEIFGDDSHEESWTYLPFGPYAALDEYQVMLRVRIESQDTLLYAILDKKAQQPVGVAGYLRMQPELGIIEIGHLHFANFIKQTTLATEAIYIMMKHVFTDLGYRRCEWKCNSLNEASRLAAQRFGFKFEGTFRQNGVYKGRNRDTAWFSVLDSEWPLLDIKFQNWLDDSNFDHTGKQIRKLSEC